MLFQEFCDAESVRTVPLHSDGEGLGASEDEPCVEGAGDTPERVLKVAEFLFECLVGDEEGSADDVGVSTEIFCGAVEHDVGSELKGLLETGCGECVVDDREEVSLSGPTADVF